MFIGEIIVGIAVPVCTVLGIVYSSRKSRQTNKDTASSSELTAYAAAVGEWADKKISERDAWIEQILKERDGRIDRITAELEGNRTQFQAIKGELSTTRNEIRSLTAKYGAAISYVRLLVAQLRSHVDPKEIEPPPNEIQPDLYP